MKIYLFDKLYVIAKHCDIFKCEIENIFYENHNGKLFFPLYVSLSLSVQVDLEYHGLRPRPGAEPVQFHLASTYYPNGTTVYRKFNSN